MNYFILCHFTFHSNELNPLASLIMLLGMGVFLAFAIYIWIGNKVDNHKLNKELKQEKDALTKDAERLLYIKSEHDSKLSQIKWNDNWERWFIKGYIEGVKDGNFFHDPITYRKWDYVYTQEEWQAHHISSMSHIKVNSEYFGGDKEMALYAYFTGHSYGTEEYNKRKKS